MPGVPSDADEASAVEVVPAPSAALVRSCAHDAWAPLLREHAHRSESIPLPPVRPSRCVVLSMRRQRLTCHVRRRLLSTCSLTASRCAATAARCVR
jgi:hypothetical protein